MEASTTGAKISSISSRWRERYAPPMSPADLAFVDGAVYTVDAARTREQAVAVKDGRIVAVGSDDAIREHMGPRTDVVALGGRMLLPGFQDAHVHPVSGGVDRLQCDLHDLH